MLLQASAIIYSVGHHLSIIFSYISLISVPGEKSRTAGYEELVNSERYNGNQVWVKKPLASLNQSMWLCFLLEW